jgi:hypothetical protein
MELQQRASKKSKNIKNGKVLFCSSSTSYKGFEEQRYIGSTVSKVKEMIEQYVLSISLEPSFALWV